MLKMLKYEFRRGIFPLLIVGIVIAAIELYFLISTLTAHADHSVIAVSLLILAAFCCYLFVLIYGIISYSQDLKNKSGYLVFMAPISSYKVIGAKLLSILLTGAIIVAVIFGLLTLDLSLAYSTYDSIDTFMIFYNILEMGIFPGRRYLKITGIYPCISDPVLYDDHSCLPCGIGMLHHSSDKED